MSEFADQKKMSKTVEEIIVTVLIKRLFSEFNLYWKFICTDGNNDKNKTNLPHTLLL